MNRWEYARAIPLFNQYLKNFELTDYERAIAQLNLAASFIFSDQPEKALQLLDPLVQTCDANAWSRLRSNALELSAQAAIKDMSWRLAENLLEEASALAGEDVSARLFIEKWRAIMSLKRDGPRSEQLEALRGVQRKAVECGDWETMRDCSLHLASVLKDPNLACRVYFGTPYRSYRANLEKETKSWLTLPDQFLWTFAAQPADRTFDLLAGQDLSGSARLKPGQALHRMLLALSSDMFRPQQGGVLFAKVFPDEYFNPSHSPQRVSQLAYRLRTWFQSHDIPIEVESREGNYRLVLNAECDLLFTRSKRSRPRDPVVQADALLNILKQAWPYKSFSSTQASERLQLSPRTVKALLRQAAESGQLRTSGTGRSKLYRFAK